MEVAFVEAQVAVAHEAKAYKGATAKQVSTVKRVDAISEAA